MYETIHVKTLFFFTFREYNKIVKITTQFFFKLLFTRIMSENFYLSIILDKYSQNLR